MKKNILVLAAHPDDEALGCGGTIAKYVRQGFFVHTAFLADGINSRGVDQNQLVARRDAARAALAILGVDSVSFSDFPDNQMDTVATIKIAIVIENLISKYSPDVVLTHHFGDVNVDHQKCMKQP
jgi:LmbE family N-acetylglucosaminyl deacetylase